MSYERELHVQDFITQHWELISDLSDPKGSGYDCDPTKYSKHTCMLFVHLVGMGPVQDP